MRAPKVDDEDRGEVSAEALDGFKAISRALHGDELEVLRKVPVLLEPRKRYPWSALVRAYEHLHASLPPGTAFGDHTAIIFEDPAFAPLVRAASHLASPARVILLGNRFGMARLFRHLHLHQQLEADGTLTIEVRIPERYEDSPHFFDVTRGIIAALPTVIGLAPAHVELERSERFGRYRVFPPASRTLLARTLRALKRLFGSEQPLLDAIEQRVELNRKLGEVEILNAELQEALSVRDRFFELISHELHTPLNGLAGAIGALAHTPGLEGSEALADLEVSAERLRFVMGDILELAKARSRPERPVATELSPEELLGCLKARTDRRARDKGLRFTAEWGPMPSAIEADRQRIERLLRHLLDNAVEFTDRGEVRFRVDIVDEQLAFEVEDTGCGIPPDHLEKVFEPFHQVDASVKRSHYGTGLGLALARVLVGILGGELALESTLGVGTRVRGRFPVRISAGTTDLPRIDPGLPVLIVDDDRLNRMVLARSLQTLGLASKMATNGEEGVAAALAEPIGLVIMDYEMPVMDGLEATRAILEARPGTVVVGWSASARAEVRDAMQQAGVRGFLDKPLARANLESFLIAHGLERHEA